jgi:hypothetical protein
MFHFAGGPPIIAHVQEGRAGYRLWAPAQVTQTGPTAVAYLPVAFVEKYLDILFAGIRGTNPVQAIILQGYAGFFDLFVKDSFQMKPLVMPAGIDVEDGPPTVDLPPLASQVPSGPERPAPLERCPGCGQELSNWQAHYPVFNDTPELKIGTRDAGQGWICEAIYPGLREAFPDYVPPEPGYSDSEVH